MVAVRRRVVEQLRVPCNYGDNDVDLAVIIQVPKRRSTMCCALTEAGACTYVLKGLVFHVLEDGVGLQIMLLRIDIGIFTDMGVGAEEVFVAVIVKVHDSSSPAAHLVRRETNIGGIGIHGEEVISLASIQREGFAAQRRNKDSGPPIVSVVSKIDTHTRNRNTILRICHAGFYPDLIEPFSPAILEQKVSLVVVGYENVHPSVCVVVSHSDAHSLPNVSGDARRLGNIRKCSVAVVVIQNVRLAGVERRSA